MAASPTCPGGSIRRLGVPWPEGNNLACLRTTSRGTSATSLCPREHLPVFGGPCAWPYLEPPSTKLLCLPSAVSCRVTPLREDSSQMLCPGPLQPCTLRRFCVVDSVHAYWGHVPLSAWQCLHTNLPLLYAFSNDLFVCASPAEFTNAPRPYWQPFTVHAYSFMFLTVNPLATHSGQSMLEPRVLACFLRFAETCSASSGTRWPHFEQHRPAFRFSSLRDWPAYFFAHVRQRRTRAAFASNCSLENLLRGSKFSHARHLTRSSLAAISAALRFCVAL
jgi:hypothetical protein